MESHNLKEVKKEIYNNFNSNLKSIDLKHLNLFLNELTESDYFFDRKLLFCLGIDVKCYQNRFGDNSQELESYLINVLDVVNSIYLNPIHLRGISWETLPTSRRFGLILQNTSRNYIPSIKTSDENNYARIVRFIDIVNNIINNELNKDLNNSVFPPGMSFEDLIVKRKQIINKDIDIHEIEARSLALHGSWIFAANNVDVTTYINDPTAMIDGLGFYIENIDPDELYFKLQYPTDFSELAFQPTTLVADWGTLRGEEKLYPGNSFFLTYNNLDGWGMTCSVSGKCICFKERVHLNETFSNLYKFYPTLLAKLNLFSTRDESEIINEAKIRYDYGYTN